MKKHPQLFGVFITSMLFLTVANQHYDMSPEEFVHRNSDMFPRINFVLPRMGPRTFKCTDHKEWNQSKLRFLQFKKYKLDPLVNPVSNKTFSGYQEPDDDIYINLYAVNFGFDQL